MVADIKTAPPPLRDSRLDLHLVPVPGRRQKTSSRIDHRNPDDLVVAQHLVLRQSGGREKRSGAIVEVGEVAGVVDNSGRVTISPFDLNFSAVGKHWL